MNATQSNETLAYIQLNRLVLSEFNVRTTPTSKEEDKWLKASIKAQGITQCLVIIKKDKQYEVIAGGRRLKQLNNLLEDGVISKDYLVPCLIKETEGNSISAISLSENIKAKMHPADEFIAFQNMINEGKTTTSIAHEFGITQTLVKKRLKMAALAPSLLEYYRNGKIDLDAIMAFTVSDNHQQQLDCYNELKPHYLYSFRIKQYLLDQALSINEPIVKFVTTKAYQKAGGSITTDLFESSSYINDRELLEALALEKLNKKATSLKKQWKWVDIVLSHNTTIEYATKLTPEPANVPDSIYATIKEKKAALYELNKIDYAQWTEEQEILEEQLENELDALDKKIDKYRHFSNEQKQSAGAVIRISDDGKAKIDFGFVKKEDIPEAFPDIHNSNSNTNQIPKLPNNTESQTLKSDLMNYKLQALQSHLMMDEKLTYNLMVFSVVSEILSTNYCDKPIAANFNLVNYSSTKDIDTTKAAKSISDFKDSLEVSWLSYSDNSERFSAFQQLSNTQKKRLLTYCTALSYNFTTGIDEIVSDSTKFALADYWKPTEDNYYRRVTTNRLLEIGKSEIGQDWEDKHKSLSKGKLVEQLSQNKKMTQWMPESIL